MNNVHCSKTLQHLGNREDKDYKRQKTWDIIYINFLALIWLHALFLYKHFFYKYTTFWGLIYTMYNTFITTY